MTEINTNHELLVVLTENAERSTPAPKSMPAPENDGGVLHRYGPRVEIRRTQPLAIGGTPLAVSPGPRGASGTLSFAEKLGIEAFTLRRSPDYRTAKANRPRDGESWDMRGCAPKAGDTPAVEALVSSMVMAPQSADGVARGSAPAPGAAMLVGSVAVGIIIVNGPNAMTQFTDSERVQVVAEVQAGLTWLGNQEPAAHITWNYEIHNVSIPTATDATADDDESRWRNPAMGSLGHTENWQGVIDYVNAMRARLQTNWAYCVFFVKGYPLWHFAYASAPRIVMDYTNDGWGPDNIDRVFAHETGHIFSCPDEYSAANCTCTSTHGIYDEPNSNCASCAPGGGTSCLMRANDWTMCLHTRRHLGWGPWRPWFSVPGQHVFDREKQQIAAVSRAPGNLDLFVIGFDNHIWTTFWNDAVGWNQEWFPPLLGQHVFDREKQQVAAVSRAPGNLDLFVIGFDNHVWSAWWSPV